MSYITDADSETTFISKIMEVLLNSNSPETEFIKTLVWEELGIALEELPAEQRKVFELTKLEGFSFKEISEVTSITVNTLYL